MPRGFYPGDLEEEVREHFAYLSSGMTPAQVKDLLATGKVTIPLGGPITIPGNHKPSRAEIVFIVRALWRLRGDEVGYIFNIGKTRTWELIKEGREKLQLLMTGIEEAEDA